MFMWWKNGKRQREVKGKQKANFMSLAEMFPWKGQHKKIMSKDLTNRFTQENAHDAIELHSHTHEEKNTHTQYFHNGK